MRACMCACVRACSVCGVCVGGVCGVCVCVCACMHACVHVYVYVHVHSCMCAYKLPRTISIDQLLCYTSTFITITMD